MIKTIDNYLVKLSGLFFLLAVVLDDETFANLIAITFVGSCISASVLTVIILYKTWRYK